MKKNTGVYKRILSALTALALCSGFFTPVFAETADTAGSNAGEETVLTGEAETDTETPAETETPADTDTDTPVETKAEEPAETPVETEETAETETPEEKEETGEKTETEETEGEEETGEEETKEEAEADEPEANVSGEWYDWNAKTGVLTLRKQLPNTDFNNNSLADQLGIDATAVKKIIIEKNTKADTSTDYMFAYMSNLTEISGLKNLDTSNVTDFSSMFWGCESLRSLDVSGLNTGKATNFYGMFLHCSSLTSLNVSGFDTQNVTDFSNMFFNCSSLTSLDVSGFKTNNAIFFYSMFSGCSSLTSLDVSGFNTAKVTQFDSMFSGCSSLTSLDVSGFETGKCTNFESMFRDCSSLTSLDISRFDTSNVTNFKKMFSGCTSLTSLDVSRFNTGTATYFDGMFKNCSSLTSLKLHENFTVREEMLLPNVNDKYYGWAKAGTKDIISGDGEYAVFTADTAGEYVRVKKIAPVSVTVSAKPTKTTYFTGDELDVTGAKLKITYDDKSTEVIDITDAMVSGFDSEKAGTQTITVTYGEKTATFTVTVKALQATKLTIASEPTKKDYYLYDKLDLTGGQLEVTYNSGKTETIPMTAEGVDVSGFDSSKTGVKKVTVKYLGKSVTFNVNVAVDPHNAPVTVGNNGYETLAQAVKSITGDGEYIITVCQELTESSVTLPKTPARITINFKNNGVIRTSSLTANCDLALNCPVVGTKDGAKAALKCANDKTITIYNKADLGAVTGGKTANLVINNDVNAVSIATFGTVTVANRKTLSVSDKVSAVNEFNGTLKMTTGLAKCTAQITNVNNGTVILTAGAKDTKTGKLVLPKVTVTDVTKQLVMRVVDVQGKEMLIPDGQPIANAAGNIDFCDKLTVDNATEAHPSEKAKIKAFMYGKEIRAEYADALTLSINGQNNNYPNFTALFNKINADFAQNPGNSYEITLNGDNIADTFVFPSKVNTSITFNGNGNTLTIPVNSISPKCNIEFNNINVVCMKSGKTQPLTLSASANHNIILNGFNCDDIAALKGTKTSELYISNDLTVKDVNTFKNVFVSDNATLTVNGKMSAIGDLFGSVKLTNAKNSSAAIDCLDNCYFTLTAGALTNKNVYTVPKVTFKSAVGDVNVKVVDENGKLIDLPGGQPVLTTNGNVNVASYITIENTVDGNSSDIKAFLNGKEYQAFYANALTLNCDTGIAGNYPNFDLLFAAIAKDNSDGWYEITLNCDMAPEKFVLPSKAGAGIFFTGKWHELRLPGISGISAKYGIEFNYLKLVNVDKKGNEKPVALNTNGYVRFTNSAFYGSVKADDFTINNYFVDEPMVTLTGLDVNILRTYANGTTSFNIVQGGQYKVKDQVRSYPEPIDLEPSVDGYSKYGDFAITVIDKNFVPVTFPVGKVTVVFSMFPLTSKYGSNSSEIIAFTNNGGLIPYVKQNKLVVEPLSGEINESDVTYRALLIGQDNIYGYKRCPRNRGDVGMMNTMLNNVKGAEGGRFHITTAYDVSSQETLKLIDTAFAGADDNDVSYFFIATHGDDYSTDDWAGALLMTGGNNDMLKLKDLAGKLKTVPGKVVVLIQACGSGAAIKDHANGDEDVTDDFDPDLFNQQVMDVFSEFDCRITSDDEDEANPKEFVNNKFYVLTASDYGEECYGYDPIYFDGKNYTGYYNIFTYLFVQGCGYYGKALADTNRNKIVTLDEMYQFIKQYDYKFTGDDEAKQHVQMYPTDSKYPLFKVS